MNHVELHAVNPDVTIPFYKDLLTYLEFSVMAEWPGGLGMGDGHTSLWFFPTPDEHKAAKFNRDATGIGHIGIHVSSREDVDTFFNNYMKPKGIAAAFDTPRAREDFGAKYYQVMFVDPEGLAVEVFTA